MRRVAGRGNAPTAVEAQKRIRERTKEKWQRNCAPQAAASEREPSTVDLLADGIWVTLCAAVMLKEVNPKSDAAARVVDVLERQYDHTIGSLLKIADRLGCEDEVGRGWTRWSTGRRGAGPSPARSPGRGAAHERLAAEADLRRRRSLHPSDGDGRTLGGAADATITYDELVERAFADPLPCVPKADAGWFIPSALSEQLRALPQLDLGVLKRRPEPVAVLLRPPHP